MSLYIFAGALLAALLAYALARRPVRIADEHGSLPE
jgi:hypothetical protein